MSVRFSILMPVYNVEKYLRQAVDSVLSQTFTDYELFAIDDGSTDGSAEVLKSYGNRINFLQQRNQGPEVARNNAAMLAGGEYLVILDSDDFFFPYALEIFDRVIRRFDSPPVITGAIFSFQDGQPIPPEATVVQSVEVIKLHDYLSKRMPLATNSIIIRKSVFDEVGGYRNSTPHTWHDDDLHLLLKAGTHKPCIIIRKPFTSAYRLHATNSIKNVKATADGMLNLARLERQGEYPGGKERRADRYAIIGGRASTWAYRYCWRNGQRKLALQLLRGTAPMVLTAAWKKSLRYLHRPDQPIVLSEE